MNRPPNLLFVFSDQHRWCDLGCYGNPQVRSPNLDAFAARAAQMDHCFSNSPLCVPARGILLTGLYPLRHGAVTNDLPVNANAVESIADVLAGAGYHTGYIGKWHLAGIPRVQAIPPGRARLGFRTWKVVNCGHKYLDDHYYDEKNRRIDYSGYEPEIQTNLALDYIRENAAAKRPWSLHLAWGPPHDPYDAVPGRFLQQYEAARLALRPNVPEHTLETRRVPLRNRDDMRRRLRGYYAHIAALDEQFGRLLAVLDQTGQTENTLVVYTSDHGDMLGSHGFCNKQLPYDEAVRVPLLVRLPGRTLAGHSSGLLGLVDLAPSLLGLLDLPDLPSGLHFRHDVDGQDLSQLFCDPAAKGRDAVYLFDYIPCHQAEDRGGTEWRALRTRRHTLVLSPCCPPGEGGKDVANLSLFDNKQDPFQTANLATSAAHADLIARLRQRLDMEIRIHDAPLGWREFLRHFGLVEEWNRSQLYFHRQPLAG
jgi:arylsulfatase A-like enzyme